MSIFYTNILRFLFVSKFLQMSHSDSNSLSSCRWRDQGNGHSASRGQPTVGESQSQSQHQVTGHWTTPTLLVQQPSKCQPYHFWRNLKHQIFISVPFWVNNLCSQGASVLLWEPWSSRATSSGLASLHLHTPTSPPLLLNQLPLLPPPTHWLKSLPHYTRVVVHRAKRIRGRM